MALAGLQHIVILGVEGTWGLGPKIISSSHQSKCSLGIPACVGEKSKEWGRSEQEDEKK